VAPRDAERPTRRQVVVLASSLTLGGGALAACSSGSAQQVGLPSTPVDTGTITPAGSTSDSATPTTSEPTTTPTTASTTRSTTRSTTKGTSRTTTASKGSTTSKPTTSKPTATAKNTAKTTAKTTSPTADDAKGALVKLSAVPNGGSVTAGGVIVYRSGSTVKGHSNVCTHQGCTVPSGGRTLQCPCHQSQFDASTGAVKQGPATKPLPAVPLVVKGGYVHKA